MNDALAATPLSTMPQSRQKRHGKVLVSKQAGIRLSELMRGFLIGNAYQRKET